MNCTETAYLAEKYENGNIWWFQKRRFEQHLKECSRCRKKYAALLLLGAIMASSAKSAEISAGITASYFMKSKLIMSAIIAIGIGSAVLYDGKSDNIKQSKVEKLEVGTVVIDMVDEKNSELKTDEIKSNKSSKFKIISKYEKKEIEITVDKESLKKKKISEK